MTVSSIPSLLLTFRGFLIVGVLITTNTLCAQIHIDGFEKGIVGNKIGVGPDLFPYFVGSSPGTALYADKPAQFEEGFKVAHFDDDNAAKGNTVLVATGPPTSYEASLAGQAFTMSFDFLEPSGSSSGSNGLFFGFSHDAAFPDLNDVSRSYGARLNAGAINGVNVVASTSVIYEYDLVHTAYLIVNDSVSPIVDYVPGRTIDPLQGHVWIELNGSSEPTFVGTIEHNPLSIGTTPKFMSFRTFIADTAEYYVDDLLLNSGATFDRDFDFGNRIPGDVNNDELIDLFDLDIIRANYFKSVAGREFGDLTEDGFVDYKDFRQWKDVYDASPESALVVVPEPNTGALLMLLVLQSMVSRSRFRSES